MTQIRTNSGTEPEVIGGRKNFWLFSKACGYDLTHPPTPESEPIYPRLRLETSTAPATIDPKKSALVITDLQNYFLSPALGRPCESYGLKVVDKLLAEVIPACRKAHIPIVWLRWGMTDQEIEELPPTIIKGFAADENFEGPRRPGPLGTDIGTVTLKDGTQVDGGRVLVKEQWNSEFYHTLAEVAEDHDLYVYKNRLSGFWGGTGVEQALDSYGIKTLIFAGCNLDQCVAGSLQDAFTKGWDCLLLSDASDTFSPGFARQCIEFNTAGGWGFVLKCKDLVDGVEEMVTLPLTDSLKQ